ncbi:MAG: ABC transporter substrate-binding protein [Methylococcales symbiont of Hymedesmia sp. n. MRB-2018]|nr:MAG: ABC transporter substrate-binding protein [Methylococcales symbiont of Hymedesmia sp. n. MRB-2018]KAF3983899.1 MAG: ABC transporter substrate-binding protein [Methylococcales symbiont of Hymedesmia sp. n. MRB-2018]
MIYANKKPIFCFLQTLTLLILCGSINLVVAADVQLIKVAYITQEKKIPAALSNLDDFVPLKGLAGTELAIKDNNTTGQFTGQEFQLNKIIVAIDGDVIAMAKQKITDDTVFVIANLSVDQLKTLADLEITQNKLIFDATTTDDSLRNSQCRDNILHILPSRAMRADALAQYLVKKKWRQWFVVSGPSEEDSLYTSAIKRAAKRFGMDIVAEKKWTHTYDARRTAQSDVPVFTQDVDYDVLVVADEEDLFGEYLAYRTWIPRPIVGTQGLIPTAWHRTHEQWGAVQMQNRFKAQARRWMEEEDYAAYLAVRSIGEASVRTHSNQMQAIKDYLLSDKFSLQGYKGNPLSFRAWNGQLRQPVLLAAARSLVAVAPIEGFLHPKTTLDTLGYDQPESACNNMPKIKNESIVEKQDNQSPVDWKKLIKQIIDKIKQ